MESSGWINFSTADVAVGTAETAVINVTCRSVRAGQQVLILAWFQITTGGTQTSMTALIRRGTGTGGTQIGESNAEVIYAAAGSTEDHFVMASDNVPGDDQTYTLNIATAGLAGTSKVAGIAVFVMGP